MLNLDFAGIAGTLISNNVCLCTWLWLTTDGPYDWSGDPYDPGLTRTTGHPVGMGGDAAMEYKRGEGRSLTPAPDSCLCSPPPPKG